MAAKKNTEDTINTHGAGGTILFVCIFLTPSISLCGDQKKLYLSRLSLEYTEHSKKHTVPGRTIVFVCIFHTHSISLGSLSVLGDHKKSDQTRSQKNVVGRAPSISLCEVGKKSDQTRRPKKNAQRPKKSTAKKTKTYTEHSTNTHGADGQHNKSYTEHY